MALDPAQMTVSPAMGPVNSFVPPHSAQPIMPSFGQAPRPMQRPMPTAASEPLVQYPSQRPIAPSRQAKAEAQPVLQFEEKRGPAYERPPLSLLSSAESVERHVLSDEALEENARMLESVLDDYGVKGEIVSVRPGPVVTMYELEPAPGLKASRVIGLADDIARSMSALSARVSTVPGRTVIGIELPNVNREKVVLREILSARDFGDSTQSLPLALGKDIGGAPVIANLAKMPHLLIAGTTGSGKSVAINTMILSLLYKLTPDECRMIMIDPKMLELSVYDGIPHLLSPVVTDPKKAVVALKWVVGEMEERYRKMSKMGVRNIEGYNSRVRDTLARGEMFKRTVQTGFDDATGEPVFETEEIRPETLPYIVVIVDEMADLMMVAGKEIEACIQRLAQMARASGIHLVMATQRPSVDVITGTIKANFPTRISFQVTGKIDSRTILGEQGAEQLLGMGDMLYMAGGSKITRVHGPFVSDEEVEEIVSYLKSFGPPEYVDTVLVGPDDDEASNIDAVLGLGGNTDGEDALYDQAVAIVLRDRKCSTSYIQRKLGIGYNKAARLVEQMEDERVVSAANHVGKREILVPEQ
jgi:S-DNA-T family DNA segregation ATPase FtsK/SpoIIIE